MYQLILCGVWICLSSITLVYSKDVNYFEITGTPGSFEKYRNPENNRFIDIYTNYPNTEAVLKNFESFRRPDQQYVYPKSNIQRSSYFSNDPHYARRDNHHNSDIQSIQSRRRGYFNLPENNNDLIKFDADFFAKFDNLQSDYGDFESFSESKDTKNKTVSVNGSENQFYIKGRPKFKTGKNKHVNQEDVFDQDYLTNIQKIPRYDELQQSEANNENVNFKIRELLKKYLIKLYKKRQENAVKDDDNDEVVDISAEISDNIESLDESVEDSPDIENYYEVVDDVPDQTLSFNNSKLLDPSKFIVLKNSTKLLANKFLSLFTIIQFPNSACVGTNGVNYYDGTCYYSTECQSMNGTAMGSCANGYGVCCVFMGTCDGSTSSNCTYFQSPNYPNYYPNNGTVLPPPPPATNGTIDPRLRYQLMMFLARQASTTNSLSCIFQVMLSNNNINQLRVDFLDLELTGPVNGSCTNERLVISGQNVNDIIPIICGYNTGQHCSVFKLDNWQMLTGFAFISPHQYTIAVPNLDTGKSPLLYASYNNFDVYVDVSGVTGPIQFAVLSSTVERKRFRIKICQIAGCANPQNCLQYYTGTQGVITSFNYDQASSLSRSVPGYFNNLNYAICIRKEDGYCSITYRTVANGTTYPFQINNVDNAGQATVPPGQAGAEIFSCPDDYIVINGIRLCGNRLNDGSMVQDFTQNAPVTDSGAGPFILPVRTNARVTGRGFRLFYTQNRCPNT